MTKHLILSSVISVVTLSSVAVTIAQQDDKWNYPGRGVNPPRPWRAAGPAPTRDLSGIWESGGMGVAGPGHAGAPLTPFGEELAKRHRPTVGPRLVPIAESNDPVASVGDPAGFPRNVLFEHKVMQIVQTPNQVLMLHMFEKRWRVVWTDGRAFPKDPDPRYYGYSVGRWANDTTLVVDTVGMDERTWLDNAGWPHSADLRVEERYHRVDNNTLEISVTINDPKVYTKPWQGLWQERPGAAKSSDKLRFTSLPPDTDMVEYIQTASEAAEYLRTIAEPTKR